MALKIKISYAVSWEDCRDPEDLNASWDLRENQLDFEGLIVRPKMLGIQQKILYIICVRDEYRIISTILGRGLIDIRIIITFVL